MAVGCSEAPKSLSFPNPNAPPFIPSSSFTHGHHLPPPLNPLAPPFHPNIPIPPPPPAQPYQPEPQPGQPQPQPQPQPQLDQPQPGQPQPQLQPHQPQPQPQPQLDQPQTQPDQPQAQAQPDIHVHVHVYFHHIPTTSSSPSPPSSPASDATSPFHHHITAYPSPPTPAFTNSPHPYCPTCRCHLDYYYPPSPPSSTEQITTQPPYSPPHTPADLSPPPSPARSDPGPVNPGPYSDPTTSSSRRRRRCKSDVSEAGSIISNSTSSKNKRRKTNNKRNKGRRMNIKEVQVNPNGSTKTTAMIRNIPNHCSRQMLMNSLDEHCKEVNQTLIKDGRDQPMSYDFVYLPMDFESGANKGYAFVNFTHPQGVQRLRDAWENKHWNWLDFSCKSSKNCQVALAFIQGKENLRKHFENMRFKCDTDEYLPVCLSPPSNGSGSHVTQTTLGQRVEPSSQLIS